MENISQLFKNLINKSQWTNEKKIANEKIYRMTVEMNMNSLQTTFFLKRETIFIYFHFYCRWWWMKPTWKCEFYEKKYTLILVIIIILMMKYVKVFRRSLNFYYCKSLKLFLFLSRSMIFNCICWIIELMTNWNPIRNRENHQHRTFLTHSIVLNFYAIIIN